MVLKSCSVNLPLYYAKLVLKKGKCLNVENNLVLKFDKTILKKWQNYNTDNSNSLIKRLFNFHAVFSYSDRKRYVQKQPPEVFCNERCS